MGRFPVVADFFPAFGFTCMLIIADLQPLATCLTYDSNTVAKCNKRFDWSLEARKGMIQE